MDSKALREEGSFFESKFKEITFPVLQSNYTNYMSLIKIRILAIF